MQGSETMNIVIEGNQKKKLKRILLFYGGNIYTKDREENCKIFSNINLRLTKRYAPTQIHSL